MRLDPADPSASFTSPSRATTVGAIIDGSRRPGGWVKKPSGERSSSPIMLLRWTPAPGTITPEPSPLVHVTAQARPSPSSTEMCVVEPSCEAQELVEEARAGQPFEELRRAGRCADSMAATSRAWLRGPCLAIEQREHVGDQDRPPTAAGW